MADCKITTYIDGASARMHNKRVSFVEKEDKITIGFQFADKDAEKPACLHTCDKGKIRNTYIKLSKDAMEALIHAYYQYKKQQYLKNKHE